MGWQFLLGQRGPQHRAEAARIAEAQHHRALGASCTLGTLGTSGQHHVQVVVDAWRRRLRQHPQRAGHAEMHQQPAGRFGGVVADTLEQQVLAAAFDPPHHALRQAGFEIRLDRPAQPAVAHRHRFNAPSHHVRQQAAPGHLDLGQFRHRTSPLVTAPNSCQPCWPWASAPSSAL
ncbi:hypothetical protein D9M68_711460 [compost metagenome]